MTTTVPIRESVGAALRFVRENIRFIAIVAATGAAALTLVGAINLAAPGLALVTTIASTFLHAFVYAAFIGAAVFAPGDVRGRWLSDGLRVWAAMAIIGFFMLIVMFAASMVASIILVAGPLGPYLQELQAAGNDDTAVLAVMTRFAEQSPGTILTLMLFLGGIWILLTSRFYIAAPASVDQQRILTFETWKWTRGAMLRITGARMMVLAPAYILLFAVAQLRSCLGDCWALIPWIRCRSLRSRPAVAPFIFFSCSSQPSSRLASIPHWRRGFRAIFIAG